MHENKTKNSTQKENNKTPFTFIILYEHLLPITKISTMACLATTTKKQQQQDMVPLRPTGHWLIPCISLHGTPLRLRTQWSPINISSGNASRIIHSEAYFMLRWLIAWDSERFRENLRVCVCLPPHNPQWLLQHASRHFENRPIPASPNAPPPPPPSILMLLFFSRSLCVLWTTVKVSASSMSKHCNMARCTGFEVKSLNNVSQKCLFSLIATNW